MSGLLSHRYPSGATILDPPRQGTAAVLVSRTYTGSYTTTPSDYTARCGAGTTGPAVTRTATSTESQEIANAAAKALALMAIVCVLPTNSGGTITVRRKAGQSLSVGSGPKSKLAESPLADITPSLTRTFTKVKIWSRATQQLEFYNVNTNAQGFTGAEQNGGFTYEPGFCAYLGEAQLFEETAGPNDLLILVKAGAVGAHIGLFLAADGDGVNNQYHDTVNTVWAPSNVAIAAEAASSGRPVVEINEWYQGETETDVPNYLANLEQLLFTDYAPYWHTANWPLIVSPTIDRPDVMAVKAQFIANHANTLTWSSEFITFLPDGIHPDAKSSFGTGYFEVAACWGLRTNYKPYFGVYHAETAGNTTTTWNDESGRCNALVAAIDANSVELSATRTVNPTSNKLAYTIGSTHRAKFISKAAGGIQYVDRTSKTLMFVVQQPAGNAPEYVFENSNYSVSPGFSSGSVASLQQYIGGVQDTSTLCVLTYELARTSTTDQDNKGLLSVYRNNVFVASGPCLLSKLDGAGLGILAPYNDTYASVSCKPGTYLQAWLAYPGTSADRRAAEYAALAARYNIGGVVTPPPPPPNPGTTITDLEPTGAYSALDFAPTEVGIYRNNVGNWYRNVPAMLQEDATLMGAGYLAANKSGRVCFQYLDASAKNGAIGFHTQPHRVALGSMAYGLYINSGGTVSVIESGAPQQITYPATLGHHYAVTRIGNTGVVRIEESADGTAWSTLTTYTATTKAALYVTSNLFDTTSQLQNPRGQSLTMLATPTANGNFVTARRVNGVTSGGVLQVPNTLVNVPAGTYWFTWTPDELGSVPGLNDFQVPLALGRSGGADEAFSHTVTGGHINARVRNNNDPNNFIFTDNITLPGAGQRVVVVMTLDANGIGLYVNSTNNGSYKPTGFPVFNSTNFLNLAAGFEAGGVHLPAGGSYGVLGIANRVFTITEVGQIMAANGLLSTIAGTTHYFLLDSLLTTSTSVADTIDATKAAIVQSGMV